MFTLFSALDSLIGFAMLIAVVYLLYNFFKLKKTVSDLSDEIADLAQRDWAGPDQSEIPGKPKEPKAAAAKIDGPWGKPFGATTAFDPEEPAAPPPEKAEPSTPKAFVFKGENIANAGRWLAQNWFLAVAALSLALAGIFLVQYGVENGLLSPFWRVMGAAFFGVALIWGGEFVRRRSGDGADSHTAYLPSTFAGAGLVALFAAVLSARQLYGLIGPEAALVYLVMVSGVGVVLGWYYGPFLAVVGILGSVAAPFLVGGQSQSPELFFYYFAIVAVAALAVDMVKRWAWVSALALILTFGAAWYIWTLGAGGEHFIGFALIAAVAAVTIPRRSLWPSHDGAMISSVLAPIFSKTRNAVDWPEFPTRLAAGTFVAAAITALLVAFADAGQGEVWLAVAALSALFLAATLWFRGAVALDDLAIVPAAFLIGIAVHQAWDFGSIFAAFQQGLTRPPETGPPSSVTAFAVLGLAGSGLAFWRALLSGAVSDANPRAYVWAAGAAVFAPLMLITLEFWWDPRDVLGPGRWAAHAIVIAAIMVLFASQLASRDADNKRRVAYFALAALTMISFALVVILSSAALTLALAVMVLGAALIDRRLDMRLLNVFIHLGVAVILWRLVLYPGFGWSVDAPLWEFWMAHLGSAALLFAAWTTLAERQRTGTRLTVESGIWAVVGVFATVSLSPDYGRRLREPLGHFPLGVDLADPNAGAALPAAIGRLATLGSHRFGVDLRDTGFRRFCRRGHIL